MALIPLKQTIAVTRSSGSDGWGKPAPGTPVTYKARVVEETRTVTNQAGEEVVTQLTIYLDKLADISYDDAITYTNELGVTVTRKPLRIEVVRLLSSKPVLTVVYV